MQVRKLEPKEHLATRKLYEEVFSEDSTSFVDYYYTEKTKDNQIYVIEEDGDIQCMLHLNPYKVVVNGEMKNVNYIVAVATRESYRRRGYMAEILKYAIRDMYAVGESFTFLMPAAESIYLPHDFRTVYEQEKRYDNVLPEGTNLSEGSKAVADLEKDEVLKSIATEEDAQKMADFANGWLSTNKQVYAWRDGAYYERLIKEMASDGAGLMLYKKGQELVDVKLHLPKGERPEEEKPKIMIRIVDAKRMLMALRLKELMAVCFEITDPIIEENNKCVVLTGTEFSGMMLMEGKPENSEGIITIAALGSLIFGAKSVEEVCGEDGVDMSPRMKEEMEKIVPLSEIYLNEVV